MPEKDLTQAISLPAESDRGILLIHGFTSTPQSMSYMAERFNQAGYHVECPVLSGHNTRWQDMDRVNYQDWINDTQVALAHLEKRASKLYAFGLSMGGTLALRLAETHHQVRAVSVVNHAAFVDNPAAPLIPFLHFLMPSVKAIAGDLKDPDAHEVAYDTVSTLSVYQLYQLCKLMRRHLGEIQCPVQIFKSHEDHLIAKKSVHYTLRKLSSPVTDMIWLNDSYHVATLDYDKALIAESVLHFFHEREL